MANDPDGKKEPGSNDAPDPLKDGLKAVAHSLRQASASLDGDDSARTVMVGKRGGVAASSLQNALRAAEAALTPGAVKPAAGNSAADATVVNRVAKAPAGAPFSRLLDGEGSSDETNWGRVRA